MQNLPYLLVAYALVWAVIFGYVLSLAQRQRRLQGEIEALKRVLEARPREG